MFAVSLTIQLPQVQTAIANKVVKNFSKKIEGDITFEKVHFKPFTTFVLKNVLIVDKNPVRDSVTGVQVDTFFRAQYIIAKFTIDGLFNNERLRFDKVYISNAQMNLVLEDGPAGAPEGRNGECLTRIFGIDKYKEDKKKSDKDIFLIKKVEIHNMGFAMKNHRTEKIPFRGGINWNDLDIRNININAVDLGFKAGVMSGKVDKVSFKEKSGWVCNDISGDAKVGDGKTIITNLNIQDKWSNLELPLFMMSYRNAKEFIDFNNLIKIDAEILPSSLDFRTLHYFAPQLSKNRIKARVSGKMSGCISDFEIKDINIAVKEGGFSGTINGRITGLPEVEDIKIDAKLSKFLVTARGMGDFISAWMQEGELDLDDYAKGIMFSLNGRAKGPLNNLKAQVSLSSMIGSAAANVRVKQILNTEKPLDLSGSVSTTNLDVSSIVKNNLLRHTTAKAGFDVKFGRTLTVPDITLDSLVIDRLGLNGYEYSGIKADGYYNSEAFEGMVVSHDPNMNFFVNAVQSKQDSITNYSITADIARADLYAMNIDDRGTSEVSLSANAEFSVTDENHMNGFAEIKGLILENEDAIYNIGDITLTSNQVNKDYNLDLVAPFAEATYSGTAPLKHFINDFQGLTLKKELPAMFKDTAYTWSGDTYRVNLLCHNMMDVLAFAVPGLYIEAGTALTTEIGEEGSFNTELNSGRVAYKAQYLKGLNVKVDNLSNNLNGEVTCDEIQVSSLKFNDGRLGLFAKDNHIGAGFSYNNDAELENHGQLVVHGNLSRSQAGLNLGMNVSPSSIYINSKEWSMLPSSVNILGRSISVDSFGLVSGEEAITVNGRTSETQNDTLTLALQRFDISLLNSIIPEIGIKGALTGTANLTSAFQKKGLNVDMICDSTYVADAPLGVLCIGGSWDGGRSSLDLMAYNDLEGERTLDATSSILLGDRRMMTQVNMDRMRISYAEPFLKSVFSEMDGYLSGSIMAGGHLDSLNISSVDCRLDEGLLTIDYTKVPYFAEGTFHLDNKGVYFDQVNIRDRYNGTGNIYGSINWDNFRNLSFDTTIRLNEIEGINLSEKDGDVFYGNIFGTGNVTITGPSNNILLNIDAVTAKEGQIHIPVTEAATAGRGTNLLKFRENTNIYIDPYEVMMTNLQKKEEEAKQADLTVNVRVTASQDVEAFVEIDKASGNVLSGRGNGVLDLSVTPEAFTINGDYTLTGGNYKFVTMGLVSRDFEIQDGSSVRFNGDLLESTLDINAKYKTKASLATLIADTTSVSSRRTVECGISISEKLSNPRLSFSIEIPDLDPTIKSRVESALSTEDKVQKQFLSLILSNSFLPDEQSGIVNNTSMLYSNVTEMLANQLSNIFQKLDIPLDLGLNYQPNEKGNDIFDVAVSTQLFNNRVVVNGSVGNKQYSTAGTQDVVGDLDIEIKLDRSGSFRLNVFSHSADSYTNFLDNSQRNGVGLTYQTEFNKFGQFVKGIFTSKAKREAAKQAEEQAIIDGGKETIKITDPVKNRDNAKR